MAHRACFAAGRGLVTAFAALHGLNQNAVLNDHQDRSPLCNVPSRSTASGKRSSACTRSERATSPADVDSEGNGFGEEEEEDADDDEATIQALL